MFCVGLGVSVFEGHAFREMARFFVCLATVVFVKYWRKLDLVIEWPVYSEHRCFLCMRMLRNMMFSVALCISVSEGTCVLRDGKILCMSGT